MSKAFSLLAILLFVPLVSTAIAADVQDVLIDPMRPDDQAVAITQDKQPQASKKIIKPAHSNLWLQSIQLGAGERSATINGKLLKIGDKIGRAKVIAIEHNQVKLLRAGEQINLMFLPRTIKR
ncbi:MAG: hypothetical protein GQ470_05985 [Gammaproteobacteria bacterium]|nr:hypothetical protein [Gammaproteobacteria bacterium]